MATSKARTKTKAVKEPSIEYEVGEQFLPVKDKTTAFDVIFRDSDIKHGLTLFVAHEQNALELWKRGEKYYVHCLIRQKKIYAKPEEIIRQLCIKRLFDIGYTADQMALEVPVKMGSTIHSKAADIVVYRESTLRLTTYIVVELKRPLRKDGIDQLESYMNATGVPFGWWLNGKDELIRYREEPNLFSSIDRLPALGETIDDVRAPRRKKDLETLVNLRELVELLEERVLANAGVSAFDEIFKLIFAKLYDEHIHGDDDALLFRRGSETPEELHERIQKLFVRATNHPGWNEIFDSAEKIQLTPQALAPCVSELEKFRFFGSDLDVLDAAFEHL